MGRAKGGPSAAVHEATGNFSSLFGEKRGMSEALRFERDGDTPRTLSATLLKYKPGTLVTGVDVFDQQTDQIKTVRNKVGAGFTFRTVSGTYVRQMKPPSRPPGPNNPQAMRGRDLLRLGGDFELPQEVREFVEEMSERESLKLYHLFHLEEMPLVNDGFVVTDAKDFFC